MSTQRRLWIFSFLVFAVLLYLIVMFAKISGQIQDISSSFFKTVSFSKPKYHFVLISQQYDNPYWKMVEQGALEAAKKEDVEIEYLGPLRSDTLEHMKIFDQAIASRVDGIITQGLIDETYTPLINKAIQSGIPVITVDTDAHSSDRLCYVGTDNYKAGQLLGQAIADTIHGAGSVGIVTGSFNALNEKERVQGTMDILKTFPNIHVVDILSSEISRVQAAAVTQTMLRAYPGISAIAGTSATDALGIYDQLKESGKMNIKIIGFDDLEETLDLLHQGIISATVVQEPKLMGEKSVELLTSAKRGEHLPRNFYTKTYILTP